jgi:hypothetical protein
VDVVDLDRALERSGEIEGAVRIHRPYHFNRNTIRVLFGRTGCEVFAERLLHDLWLRRAGRS